jgi:hypothetical protein
MDTKPFEILVDPHNKVLFSLDFNPGEDLLVNSLSNSSVIQRIRAAKELIKVPQKNPRVIINILDWQQHFFQEIR